MSWKEWEVPPDASDPWPEEAARLHDTLGKAYRVKMPDSKTRPLLRQLNALTGNHFRKIEQLPCKPVQAWKVDALKAHAEFWEALRGRQRELDSAIAASAKMETLYDRPVKVENRVKCTAPYVVERLADLGGASLE